MANHHTFGNKTKEKQIRSKSESLRYMCVLACDAGAKNNPLHFQLNDRATGPDLPQDLSRSAVVVVHEQSGFHSTRNLIVGAAGAEQLRSLRWHLSLSSATLCPCPAHSPGPAKMSPVPPPLQFSGWEN